MNRDDALRILRQNTFPTLGCTDPVAIGLAVAHARSMAEGEILGIRLRLDRNVYKDSVSVGIPGIREAGIELAVALAVIRGKPEDGLELFRNVRPGDIEAARAFLADHEVHVALDEEAQGIRIHASIETDRGVYEALIEGSHDRLAEKKKNGKTVFRAEAPQDAAERPGMDGLQELGMLTLGEIIETAGSLDAADLSFLSRGIEINLAAARAGLAEQAGMGLGRALRSLVEEAVVPDSVISRIRIAVAAAADARMGGLKVPVWGCFGSGNHGITLFISVGELGRELGKSPAEIARALALGLLVVGVIKTRTGILTPHCGCAVAAGTGVAAAAARLLGGSAAQIENAVQLMSANLTGMLCDGAKYGCALKMSTSAGVALETAYLAVSTGAAVPAGNGIVGGTFQSTMDNLGVVTDRGMKDVDRAVLDILLAPPAGKIEQSTDGR